MTTMKNTPTNFTAAEISNLWNTYFTNTMTIWISRYFLANAQDEDISNMLKNAEYFSVKEMEKSKKLLESVHHPLPEGFNEQDVELQGEGLYSDTFALLTKYILSQDGCTFYSMSLSSSIHADVRQFYEYCWMNASHLFNECAEIMIKKGLHHPQLRVPTPERGTKSTNNVF